MKPLLTTNVLCGKIKTLPLRLFLSGKAFFVSSNRVKYFEQSSNYIKSNRFINNKEI